MSQLSMHEVQFLQVGDAAWLRSRAGALWVTRDGDPADYILGPGQRLALGRGDRVAIGAWPEDQDARWDWQPMRPVRPYRRLRDFVALALGGVARGLRGAADALAAAARSAASIASRAQGCIRAGDSTASAGTVQ